MPNGDGVIFRNANSADPVESPASKIWIRRLPDYVRRSGLGGAALLSLAVGFSMGLVLAWLVWPISYTNAEPSGLRQDEKDDYVVMISSAYQMDGDLGAARDRLAQLRAGDPASIVASLIARAKATPGSAIDMTALTILDDALTGRAATLNGGPAAPIGTPGPIVVVTTPTAAVLAFSLARQDRLTCQDTADATIEVTVLDASGRDLPNVAIQVHGPSGDEVITTGLKPERGLGYADYAASTGTWSVSLLNAQSDTVSDLAIGDPPADCPADGGATPRGWKLVFQEK